MQQPKILVIDDEKSMGEFLQIMLSREGYDVTVTQDPTQAVELFKRTNPVLTLTDIKMKPIDGITLLRSFKELNPEANVVLITAYASLATAVEALRLGARDYLIKPFKIDAVRNVVRQARNSKLVISQSRSVMERLQATYHPTRIIGKSPLMRQIFTQINKVKDSQSTVLVTGESGTGKELIAKAIHYSGSRQGEPFVSINCGALPENLLENELFGHEEGGFTGATHTKEGLFEVARQGTFFLDEVGEMSLSVQVKLLRAIQEHEIQRIGGTKPISIHSRVIAATSKDLAAEVAAEKFRKDLYYRLNVIPINLPPLRDRKEDIPEMARTLLRELCLREKKEEKTLHEKAIEMLQVHDWPGNVRELQNVIERATALVDSSVVMASDLCISQKARLSYQVPEADTHSLKGKTDEYERQLIQDTLVETGGNISQAATALKLSRQGLQYKLKKYKIDVST
jgi:DNA-binding NtrC family response regulator